MKLKNKLCLAITALLASDALYAVPKLDTAPVLMENDVMVELSKTTEGKAALAFMTSLNTYQDSDDTNKFYYFPAYFPSTSVNGAATIVTNDSAVERRSEIDDRSADITEIQLEEFSAIRAAYKALTEKLGDASLTADEIEIINASRLALKEEMDALNAQAQDNQGGLPEWVLDIHFERMADLFGLSGFPMSLEDIKNTEERGKNLDLLSSSNGGIFSGNLVAGYTADQINQIRLYKSARADLGLPEVKLSILPVQAIEFESLAETVENSKINGTVGTGIPLFRSFNAGGSPSAATYNFDLTLDGAEKFSKAPPPISVPIAVKAQLTVRPPKFTASLECDFTTGWTVKGRTDVKDGLIIYNNDIWSTMVAKDISQTNKPCTLITEGGSGGARELAYAKSLNSLMGRFNDLFFKRTELAYQDKMKYWNGVQQDIANNRHQGANDGWSGLFTRARGLGFVGSILGGFSNASRFYWHTDVRDITALSQVKFEQQIVLDENQVITVGLGTTDMCLAYNVDRSLYVPCDQIEERGEVSVGTGANQADTSCSAVDTVQECETYRENGGADVNNNGNIPPETPVDDPVITLPDEI